MGKKKDEEHLDALANAAHTWAYRYARAEELFHGAANYLQTQPVPRQEADELVEAIHTAVGRAMAAEVK